MERLIILVMGRTTTKTNAVSGTAIYQRVVHTPQFEKEKLDCPNYKVDADNTNFMGFFSSLVFIRYQNPLKEKFK